jgi:RNA-directed DNA polymerase
MTVNDLTDYLKQHWPAIREPDGGVRKLGIPTVLDRFIQPAVMQVLQRRWDLRFPGTATGLAANKLDNTISIRYGPHVVGR